MHDLTSEIGPFQGDLVTPGMPAYDEARKIWNEAIDRHPALIARCATRRDVQLAVRLAKTSALPLAVRGGGHSYAGFGSCDGGIVIDLRAMRDIDVDPQARTVKAGPGLTWGELDERTQAHGLATTGGHITSVGIAGFTLGGGIGWLSREHGLAVDNLVAVEIVLANGDALRASDDENQDLFWAIRGGGGNFGIVTEFTYRLHEVSDPLGGMLLYSAENAEETLRYFRHFSESAPDDVTALAAFITAPDAPFVPQDLRGKPALAIAAACLHPTGEGKAALARLQAYGPPAVDLVGPSEYLELQRLFDGMAPSRPAYIRSRLLSKLTDSTIATLTEYGLNPTSPNGAIVIIPLGGAIARVSTNGTAFSHRKAAYHVELCAFWENPDEPATRHRVWADGTFERIKADSVGVYVNHLGNEGPDRVREAYGAETYQRLATIKRRYDPTNLFRGNQNIPPA